MSTPKPLYSSIHALLETDAKSPMDDSKLDDQLWLMLCDRIKGPSDLLGSPAEVEHYYASRLVQWEVGNGGFAQAAYNCPEWFLPAALAYETLGRPEFAKLIRRAQALLPEDSDDLEDLEEQFEALDEELSGIDWEIDEARITYVRQHAKAFSSL